VLRVAIDADRCSGHGRCYALAPAVFEPDDEGYGQLVAATVPDEQAEAARLAHSNCPEYAITVTPG